MDNEQAVQLVLLPGLDGTGKLFETFVSALPADIKPHIVAYPSDQLLSLSQYAQLVAGRLPRGRVVVLAESFSGLVALTLLERRDVAIDGVIFCAAFAEPPRPLLLRLAPLIRHAGPLVQSAPAFMLRQFCLGEDATSEQLALLRQTLAQVPLAVLAHRLQLIAGRHAFLRSRCSIPCCYLQAAQDRLVPATASRWFAQHFETFRVESIEGPHFLLQARPALCAQATAAMARSVGLDDTAK